MTARYPTAFLLSATLHGAVLAAVLMMTYLLNLPARDQPKIFELVAGEGNNYAATVAPALGTPGGVKLNVPAPKPEAPVKVEPTPTKPEAASVVTPAPKAPATKTTRTPAQEIRRLVANADLRAKREVAKQREEEQKRLTKEEFDRANKARVADKSPLPKAARIDAEGIAKGVAGGSTANKEGGANGRALTSTEGSALERYESALIAALRRALEEEKPPGLSESLIATVEFRISVDGTLSGVRITRSSGSADFDNAVRAAFRRVGSIGPRPDGKSEVLELDFLAREPDGE
jgi:colicin import membrane protein